MNMNKTISSIVITSILPSLPTISDTNNDPKVGEVIAITDILRSHTKGGPAPHSVRDAVRSPDRSKLLIRCTSSTSRSEQVDDLYVMNTGGTESNRIVSSGFIKLESAG